MEFSRVETFLEYYEKVRARTKRLIDVVPEDRFDWTPLEGKFTIADIIRHLAAIERYMYAENVQGKPSRYPGCGPDIADGPSDVIAFFDRCHLESVDIFRRLTPEDLKAKCKTPAGTPITTWKWLRLLPEHEIHHRGQLYTYLAFLDVEAPPIYGMTSEQVAAASSRSRA